MLEIEHKGEAHRRTMTTLVSDCGFHYKSQKLGKCVLIISFMKCARFLLSRSSITRMSGDQKQNVVLRNVEEERQILRQSSVTEEDRVKSSESSEVDSEPSSLSSESEDSETG